MALIKQPVSIKTVYVIVNKANGSLYVGQTTQPLAYRFRQHKNRKRQDQLITRAIKKYGPEVFEIGVLGTYATQEDLDNAERYFIQFLNTLAPAGYNMSEGGTTRPAGWKHTAETCAKISAAGKGRKPPPASIETRQKMSEAKKGKSPWNKGRKSSPETCLKQSLQRKGCKSPWKGAKWTDEQKRVISERTKEGMRKAGYGIK